MGPFLVAGLGNPGREYANTWHNAGFWVVDQLAARMNVGFRGGRGEYEVAKGWIGQDSVVLIKPVTYMNLSGYAVRDAIRFFDCELDRCLIVFDDHDLPIGRLRIRKNGSDGGHRGMRSIIAEMGTDQIARVRIGIRPEHGESGQLAGKVLAPVPAALQDNMKEATKTTADAVECFVRSGVLEAMNRFNSIGKKEKKPRDRADGPTALESEANE